MRRFNPLRIERLEDRTTPSGMTNPLQLTVSFVPDGTQVGSQQSNLFQDMNALAPTAVWQQQILDSLQTIAAQANATLTVVPDDGASLTSPAPQDGAIRIAAVDQLFASDGTAIPAGPTPGYLVTSGAATFGAGLGLIGPNGQPLSPVSPSPGPPSATLLPIILPIPRAFGNLYPTTPTPTPPAPISPDPIGSAPTSPPVNPLSPIPTMP
jgi:hypothetical protein